MQIRCDCQQTLQLPEDFFEGAAYTFFRAHGHFPDAVVLTCAAGHTHSTGPTVEGNPAIAADTAID